MLVKGATVNLFIEWKDKLHHWVRFIRMYKKETICSHTIHVGAHRMAQAQATDNAKLYDYTQAFCFDISDKAKPSCINTQ